MKKLIACLAAIVLSCGILAGCGSSVTPESVAKKSQEVATKLTALTQSDPARAQQIGQEMLAKVPNLQNPNDLEALDKFYDEILEKMK